MPRQIGPVAALAALVAAGCGGNATNKPSGGAGTGGSASGGHAGSASGGMVATGGASGHGAGGNAGAAVGLGGAGGTAGSGGEAGSAAAGRAGSAGGTAGAAAGGLGGGAGIGGQGGYGGGGGCPPNEMWGGSFCSPPPPKLVAPFSGSAVGTSKPDLLFEFAKGFTFARLDVCADRACAQILESHYPAGDVSGVAAIGLGQPLPNGMIYWRGSTAQRGSTVDVLTSPVWEFAVLASDKFYHPLLGWPQFADIERDGFADLVVLSNSGGVVTVDEYPGSFSGLLKAPSSSSGPLSGPSCPEPSLAGVGDIDGDGFGDVVIGDCDSLDVLAGGPRGFALPFSYRTALPGTFATLMVSGDINGDGYADVAGIATTGPGAAPQLWQFFGSPQGLIVSPAGPISLPAGADDHCTVQVLGDITPDGYAYMDVAVADRTYDGGAGVVWIFNGGEAGLSPMPTTISPPVGAYNFGSFPASLGGTMRTDILGGGIPFLLVGGTTDAAGMNGQVYVYPLGRAGEPTGSPVLLFPGGASGLSSITGADIDGDGFGDVVVGVGGQIDVFRGSSSGLPSSPSDVLVAPNVAGANGGQRVQGVAELGDVNGDGAADFAAEISGSGPSPPVVPVVYPGSAGALSQVPALTLSGSQAVSLW